MTGASSGHWCSLLGGDRYHTARRFAVGRSRTDTSGPFVRALSLAGQAFPSRAREHDDRSIFGMLSAGSDSHKTALVDLSSAISPRNSAHCYGGTIKNAAAVVLRAPTFKTPQRRAGEIKSGRAAAWWGQRTSPVETRHPSSARNWSRSQLLRFQSVSTTGSICPGLTAKS